MSLVLQIKTILLSLIYGAFLYYFLYLNKKILYNAKVYIKALGAFSIMLLLTFLYFLLLKNINNGIFHIYEIISIIISYTLIAYVNKK